MNNWSVIGLIFFSLGVLLLSIAVGLGFQATSALDQIGGSYQLKNTVFMAVAMPYLVGSGITFIIGIVGIIAGSSEEKTKIQASQSAPVLNRKTDLPPPQTIKCPSCGKNMVFVAEHQKWYCPYENYYLQ